MLRDVNAIDKKIRCVWHADGPEFVRLQNVQKATGLRRVGNMYYDRGFAEAFLHAASVSHGSLHKVQTHFLRTCRRENGQLASLIPRGNNGFLVECDGGSDDIAFGGILHSTPPGAVPGS